MCTKNTKSTKILQLPKSLKEDTKLQIGLISYVRWVQKNSHAFSKVKGNGRKMLTANETFLFLKSR